jgi:flagellar basal-body rod modification protein FlgD
MATAVDPLSVSATQPTTNPNAFSALDSEQFVKIIFTELSNQDPLQPSDSNQLLQELSTLRSIQSDTDLSTKLTSLVGQNEWASASSLIGKTISGLSDTTARVQGVVRSVSRTSDGAVLNLASGDRVPVANVDEILGATGTTQ